LCQHLIHFIAANVVLFILVANGDCFGGACPASKNCANNKDVFLAINIPVLFLTPMPIVLGRGLLFLFLFDNIYQAIIALKQQDFLFF